MNRGFIFSLSAVFLLTFYVSFSVFYLDVNQRYEASMLDAYPAIKSAYVADDIAGDFNRAMGTGIDINRDANSTVLTVTDRLPADINKLQIIDIASFYDVNYALKQNADVNLDVNNLVDGIAELFFTNGLQYDYNYTDVNNPIVVLYRASGDTNALDYNITVHTNGDLNFTSAWDWNSSGDVNASIAFGDEDGNSVLDSGTLSSVITNTYEFRFSETAGDYLLIEVGNIGGNLRALKITESIDNNSTYARVRVVVKLPAESGDVDYYYNANFAFSQGDFRLSRKVVMGSG